MKIVIIGNGFVGKATKLLECNQIEILNNLNEINYKNNIS